ncbi:MAG TPA: hypothetical protein VGE72_10065 [Azospirillum sp.]
MTVAHMAKQPPTFISGQDAFPSWSAPWFGTSRSPIAMSMGAPSIIMDLHGAPSSTTGVATAGIGIMEMEIWSRMNATAAIQATHNAPPRRPASRPGPCDAVEPKRVMITLCAAAPLTIEAALVALVRRRLPAQLILCEPNPRARQAALMDAPGVSMSAA